MNVSYDEQVDAAYLRLDPATPPKGVSKTVPVDPAAIDGEINLDFDSEGHLVGIEVQDASRFLPPSVLASAKV